MNANDRGGPPRRAKPLPVVRVTFACRGDDGSLRDLLHRYRAQGIFVPTDRVRPVGERVLLKIQLVDGSADYASEAVVTAHRWQGSRFGMTLQLDPPRHAAPEAGPRPTPAGLAPPPAGAPARETEVEERSAPAGARAEEPAQLVVDDRPLAVSLAEYLCEPSPPAASGGGPAAPRDPQGRPPIEGIALLHRTLVKNRDANPAAAMAAAEAMLEIVRSDPDERVVRFVRRLTRDGHDILELALERLESASTPEGRRLAQRLFDEALRIVVVP